jgi:hypothetical protein
MGVLRAGIDNPMSGLFPTIVEGPVQESASDTTNVGASGGFLRPQADLEGPRTDGSGLECGLHRLTGIM